ncbi:hypothetical protein ACE7GA_11455 [Roseomonas sp. CCTCC AB2023176]|uniref:hypothetical protein n=1 Tax=Roseomonas sp. CCTCC AB2023176 TaxID=3342640 RepID=UPI0035E187C0
MRGVLLGGVAALLLAGCDTVADATGAVSGIAAGTATGNPALGYGIGLGVRAGAAEALRYGARRWHRTEQDVVAAVIGATPPGESRPWRVRHSLPIGNEEGEVRVLREIRSPLATCREALFSVAEDGGAAWFVTTACRAPDGSWSWAAAEPAVPRWGNLQ